jgi:hypothetical protein
MRGGFSFGFSKKQRSQPDPIVALGADGEALTCRSPRHNPLHPQPQAADTCVNEEDLTVVLGRECSYLVVGDLGKGAFARVSKVLQLKPEADVVQAYTSYRKHRKPGSHQCYAMKTMKKAVLKKKRDFRRQGAAGELVMVDGLDNVEQEIAVMKKMAHANVTKIIEFIDEDEVSPLAGRWPAADGSALLDRCADVTQRPARHSHSSTPPPPPP